MLIGDLLDTLLNLGTFAFLGAMICLLRRPLPNRPASDTTHDAPLDQRDPTNRTG